MDPEEYNKFTKEMCFTARRTDNFFAGIHTDQTIEQTLMKSMSVEGGPFRRGATDSVVYQWINGVVCTSDIIEGMETFCNISFKKSHQHADFTDARITRGDAEIKKLKEWLQSHDPFSELDVITNIATGVIDHEKTINCYNAFDQGIETVKKINGQNFRDLKLKTSQKVVPLLAANSKLKINNEHVPIDPLLLFQRITVLKKSDTDLQNYMKNELAPYLLSLYDDAGM
ncbi:PREDICTED: uncharacterized protein LOC108767205 [Trachymyrmex cornetzi]|nr:PREDICTED: uncharacterized protein LOC108767205 [Trachymyrmex cornetzi]